MNYEKIMNFDQFVHKLNESDGTFGRMEESGRDKTVSSDNFAKVKTDDTNIKIKVEPVDSVKGEVLKFGFKYINSGDIQATDQDSIDAEIKKKAGESLAKAIASQVGSTLNGDEVGMFQLEKEGPRASGDQILKGMITFYKASQFQGKLPTDPTAIITTVKSQSVQEAKLFEDITVYDASKMQTVAGQSNPSMDMKAAIQKLTFDDPSNGSTTKTTTIAPVVQGETTTLATVAPETTLTTTAIPAKATQSYVNLAIGNTVNLTVKDLQARIIVKGGEAATLITNRGGADGRYGPMTARAIGLLVNGDKTKHVDIIDQTVSDKLIAALSGIDQAQVDKLKTASHATHTAQSLAVKTTNHKVPTLYF